MVGSFIIEPGNVVLEHAFGWSIYLKWQIIVAAHWSKKLKVIFKISSSKKTPKLQFRKSFWCVLSEIMLMMNGGVALAIYSCLSFICAVDTFVAITN